MTINGIENTKIETKGIRYECGTLCEVVPCGEEYGGKSYIGIYIGDLPISITTSLDEKTCILKNSTFNNPAIFVPELKEWFTDVEVGGVQSDRLRILKVYQRKILMTHGMSSY